MVLRPALNTGFSEMGWGSTPPSSAKLIDHIMTANISLSDLRAFRTQKIMPSDWLLVDDVARALLRTLGDAPKEEQKRKYLWQTLDHCVGNIDWSHTFTGKIGIVCDDILTPEILIEFHYWLRRKCANISNVVLIATHHHGLQQWWQQWQDSAHETSFGIVDSLPSERLIDHYLETLTDIPESDPNRINYYFSYYGGTKSLLDREYLTVEMLNFYQHSIIDRVGKFWPKSALVDYLENISYYLDQPAVELFGQVYDQYIGDSSELNVSAGLKEILEQHSHASEDLAVAGLAGPKFGHRGIQWAIDQQCFATVVRESNMETPYSTITEKTWRAFYHGLMVIPTGYNAVAELEQRGFFFPHEIFNYDYQSKTSWYQRVQALKASLTNLIQDYTIEDLRTFRKEHADQFQQNQQLIANLKQI